MPRLAQDTARLQPPTVAALSPIEAAAIRDGASARAAIADAVAGDLTATSPALAAKLADIEGRLDLLEGP